MVSLYIIGVLAAVIIVTLYKGIKVVPQGEEWVIERLGKYSRSLNPGLNLIIPYIDSVRQRMSTRDIILDVPQQEVITMDNAVILTNAIAFVRVTRPSDAVYGVEDFRMAIVNLVMTTLRSIIGEMKLDEALSNRDMIKARLKEQIIDDVADWGVTVKSVEIQDISPSPSMQKAMEQQAAAERERRAVVTKAEGNKNAMILEAEGKLEAAKLEAQAQVALAQASAEAIARRRSCPPCSSSATATSRRWRSWAKAKTANSSSIPPTCSRPSKGCSAASSNKTATLKKGREAPRFR